MHCIPVFPHKGQQRQGKPGVCVVSSRSTKTTNTQEHLALGGRSPCVHGPLYFLFLIFLCVLSACVYVHHVCALCPKRNQKVALDLLELELRLVVSPRVYSGG